MSKKTCYSFLTHCRHSPQITFHLVLALFLLSACQGEDTVLTTPIPATAIATETKPPSSSPTVLSPTSTEIPPTETAASLPEELETPTSAPTETLVPTATKPSPPVLVETISVREVVSGLTFPTSITHAFDDRLFVTEQAGTIRIVLNEELVDQPFLDITDRVGSSALEQGLLSAAFPESFPETGIFYVNYTNINGDTVISRFSRSPDDPNQAAADSEEILLTISQPYRNHNGGQLQFGPDGMLYIGVGDGGSAGDPHNNGQNSSTLLGSLLRIDVNQDSGYSVPAGNPFTADPSVPDEIWAIGLRNPWRFSFDRRTGDLYLADVGQSSWEEVNYAAAPDSGGQNYGWNIMEGAHCYSSDNCSEAGLTLPIIDYSHSVGGCSISGGYVYRGAAFDDFSGNYFFGDYCSGIIWSLVQGRSGEWNSHLVYQSGVNISTFGEDARGEIYFADHIAGTIFQIQP